MKMRITGMAMMAALLAACGQAPEKTGETAPAVAPAPTAEAPAAVATVVEKEPSAEDGVDPSVSDNEGEPEDPSAGGELTCVDNPLATHSSPWWAAIPWTTAAARIRRCWPRSTP